MILSPVRLHQLPMDLPNSEPESRPNYLHPLMVLLASVIPSVPDGQKTGELKVGKVIDFNGLTIALLFGGDGCGEYNNDIKYIVGGGRQVFHPRPTSTT